MGLLAAAKCESAREMVVGAVAVGVANHRIAMRCSGVILLENYWGRYAVVSFYAACLSFVECG